MVRAIMAKAPKNLDRLSDKLRQQVLGMDADPDFVDFVLGWYGLLEWQKIPPPTWPYWSRATQLKKQRQLKQQHGATWRTEWERMKAEAKAHQKVMKVEANLFALAPEAGKVGHQPIKSNFWFAMSDIQRYFRRVCGKPRWALVSKILFPRPDGFVGPEYATAEYAKRKTYLKQFDDEERLDKVMAFYKAFKPVILDVLNTRTPIWAAPHRAKAQVIAWKFPLDWNTGGGSDEA